MILSVLKLLRVSLQQGFKLSFTFKKSGKGIFDWILEEKDLFKIGRNSRCLFSYYYIFINISFIVLIHTCKRKNGLS